MAVSARARDILDLLPEGCVLYADSEQHLSFQLPRTAVLSSSALLTIHEQLWTTRCDINFETRMLHLHFNTAAYDPMVPGSPRTVDLKAVTVSEKQAAEMASSLGCIDYDHLQPSMRIATEGDTTTLYLGRLLHISHNALEQQLSAPCTEFAYHFVDREIALNFVAKKKRGRT